MVLGIGRWLMKTFLSILLCALVLYWSSGRWDWIAGRAYLIVLLGVNLLTAAVLIPTRPALLVERAAVREGTQPWDLWLSTLMALFGPLLIYITAGLEARWKGAFEMIPAAGWGGLLLAAAGGLFTLWAMYANPFFAATVRIQAERGHTVSTGGPYRFVRHPGYLGAIVYMLGVPFALGSVWAVIPALMTVGIIVLRTALEDKTLQAELSGYRDYARRVRYKLLPGVW